MFKGMAALAALLVALPAAAQMQVTPYNGTANTYVTGTLTTSGDLIPLAISGSQWATVQWTVVGAAGTITATLEVSFDGGIGYIPAPYSKRLFLSANPTVNAMQGVNLTSNSTWETPLPSTVTNIRFRCNASGTSTTVQMYGGTPYVPSLPVVAVLYDTTATAGANNNTPTIDVTGWREITTSIVVATAATGAASLNIVDDAGVAIPVGTSASIATGTYVFGWGDSGTFGTANPFTIAGGATSLPLDRRFNIAVAGATTSSTRTRVVARR